MNAAELAKARGELPPPEGLEYDTHHGCGWSIKSSTEWAWCPCHLAELILEATAARMLDKECQDWTYGDARFSFEKPPVWRVNNRHGETIGRAPTKLAAMVDAIKRLRSKR